MVLRVSHHNDGRAAIHNTGEHFHHGLAIGGIKVAGGFVGLADEPTGNLDTANGEAVMEMLTRIMNGGTTIVMVTHSEDHAKRAHRVVNMLDGRLVDSTEA